VGLAKGGTMTLLIKGVYRDGAFYPNEPVALADNTEVSMAVDAIATATETNEESDGDRERTEIHEILVAAGVVRPGPVPGPTKSPLSPEREAEIARKLAEIGSIYEIIREERDSN
jgi:hypothetical protein